MLTALWSINVGLWLLALALLPWAWRRRDRIALGGIALTTVGFVLATVALLNV